LLVSKSLSSGEWHSFKRKEVLATLVHKQAKKENQTKHLPS